MRNPTLGALLSTGLTATLGLPACGNDCDCPGPEQFLPDAGDDQDAARGGGGGTGGTGGSTSLDLEPGCWEGFAQCNPRDETSCGTDGSTCDYGTNRTGRSGLFCFGPPNTQRIGENCSNLPEGPFCAPTLHCAGVPGKCAKICCTDSDCSVNEWCDPIDPDSGWSLGTCQPEAVGGSGGTSATGGSSGAGAAGSPPGGQGGAAAGAAGAPSGGGAAGAAGLVEPGGGGGAELGGAAGTGAVAGAEHAAGAAGSAGVAGARGGAAGQSGAGASPGGVGGEAGWAGAGTAGEAAGAGG